MKDKNYVWISLVAISALFSYLIISDKDFPYLGLATSFATLSVLAYIFKTEKSNFHKALLVINLLLSFCLVFRANPFLIFLNINAIIFLGSLMVLTPKNTQFLGFMQPIFAPFEVFFRSLVIINEYKLDKELLKKDKLNINPEKTLELAKSLGLSAIILIIIIPLLASANPLFGKLIENIFSYLSLTKLFEFLFSENMFIWMIRLAFTFILAFLIPRFLTLSNNPPTIKYSLQSTLHHFHLLIPKILTALVIFVFFITQAQLYFSSQETLKAMGYTHSQYVNEVFAQLTIVAMIIGGLIYNDKNRNKESKSLTYILVIEGVFLALMALKSVSDYHTAWGLTHKRLWGYTGVIWIIPVLLVFAYKYYKDLSDTIFAKIVIAYSGLILIAVNLTNFDYLIYHYDKSRTQAGADYEYLISNLSTDAVAYKEMWEILSQPEYIETSQDYWLPNRLINEIEYLQSKYAAPDLRSINLSEYNQYLQIKDIDIMPVRNRIQNKYYQNSSYTNPSPNSQAPADWYPWYSKPDNLSFYHPPGAGVTNPYGTTQVKRLRYYNPETQDEFSLDFELVSSGGKNLNNFVNEQYNLDAAIGNKKHTEPKIYKLRDKNAQVYTVTSTPDESQIEKYFIETGRPNEIMKVTLIRKPLSEKVEQMVQTLIQSIEFPATGM